MSKLQQELRTLTTILHEDDEFKRYMFLQMWLQQFYTPTITNTIKNITEQLSDTENIYNTFVTLKKQLLAKNQQLEQVVNTMSAQLRMLVCMNKLLEVEGTDEQVDEYKRKLNVIKQMVSKNTAYIERIDNLSQSKIDSVCKQLLE